MNSASYYLLDVFTSSKFGGNQLAVFPDASRIPEELMPKIARELNLSETVFLRPKNELGQYPMRIFTPTSELPTAGHPTIGTAYYLARNNVLANGTITVELAQKIGIIPVEVQIINNAPSRADMFQPLPEFGRTIENRERVAELLSLSEGQITESLPVQIVSCGVPYLIVPLRSLDDVAQIKFRLDIWDEVKDDLDAFVYAFAMGGIQPGSHVHGRMFAPEAGILEDPATGSANGPLGCYLYNYGLQKGPIVSEQGFELGRPSIINIEIDGPSTNEITQVKVGGNAVFIGQGEIFLENI